VGTARVNWEWHLTLVAAATAAASACWKNLNSQHRFKKAGNSLKETTA